MLTFIPEILKAIRSFINHINQISLLYLKHHALRMPQQWLHFQTSYSKTPNAFPLHNVYHQLCVQIQDCSAIPNANELAKIHNFHLSLPVISMTEKLVNNSYETLNLWVIIYSY